MSVVNKYVAELDGRVLHKPAVDEAVRQHPRRAYFATALLASAFAVAGVVMLVRPSAPEPGPSSAGAVEVSPYHAYRFEFAGRIHGLDLPARSLRIGISRLGELSSIVSSGMHANAVGSLPIVRLPKEAMTDFETQLLQQYPEASSVEFSDVQIGFALAEESSRTVAEPSVLLRYSLAFEDSSTDSAMVSRSESVSLSLVSERLDPAPLAALDPNPAPGDTRHDR